MRIVYYLALRLAIAALTLVGVSILVFAGLRLLPGGFEQMVLGPDASVEARAELVAKFGLDQSGPAQYVKWLGAAAAGDLGVSMATSKPVADEMLRRAPATCDARSSRNGSGQSASTCSRSSRSSPTAAHRLDRGSLAPEKSMPPK